MNKYLIINKLDNVMVAIQDLKKGEVINGITLLEDVKTGHKIAVRDIKSGENIIKYGYPMGHAKASIEKGARVHTHNVETNLSDILEYQYHPIKNHTRKTVKQRDVFLYERENGEYGIRNEIYLIPTVGCINSVVKRMADDFNEKYPKNKFFDGVLPILHPYGCSQMGDDLVNTKETLQNISKHPNAGGVIVLGLGCENNRLKEFKEYEYNKKRVRFLNLQDLFNEDEEVFKILKELYEQMSYDKRVKRDLSSLKIGLKCGGSDAFSGITANPLIGLLSDYIISAGGTTVLTEVPEMFGAETILMNRTKDEKTFKKLVALINDFKKYYKAHNQVIYDNPSPGNKDGGITTLEEKSLGCIEKGGKEIIQDVLKNTERLKSHGLNVISAPGNDLISVTTLAMSGSQMVLFSTGRGTPFGGFVPTLKISTNREIAKKKPHWIDFDAGRLLENVPFEVLLEELLDLIVKTANGEYLNNEKNNAQEIAIFKQGVTL